MSAERSGPPICNVSNIGEGKDEMTKASIDLQDLRRRIYVKAKAEPSWRFWGLYVHVCKMETLRAAYEMAKSNDGAPGIDGVTFEAIEAQGVEALLEQLRDELIGRTYQPLPARRQEIPKDGGKVRVLSIPAIRDRVVQGALKLILEPVFEADFQPGSFGYRPKRTAHDAIKRVAEAIVRRKTRVLDFDLRAYFDNVRHDRLLAKVAQRIDDADVMHLLNLCGLSGAMRPHYTPKLKKRTALVRALKEVFRRHRSQPIERVIALINPVLRGWVNYFAVGHSSECFSFIKDWVEKKVRRHLAHAQKRKGFDWERWNRRWLYDTLGLFNAYRVRRDGPKVAPAG